LLTHTKLHVIQSKLIGYGPAWEVKRPEREDGNLSQVSAKLRKSGAITPSWGDAEEILLFGRLLKTT
jgi:hypothetical protein